VSLESSGSLHPLPLTLLINNLQIASSLKVPDLQAVLIQILMNLIQIERLQGKVNPTKIGNIVILRLEEKDPLLQQTVKEFFRVVLARLGPRSFLNMLTLNLEMYESHRFKMSKVMKEEILALVILCFQQIHSK